MPSIPIGATLQIRAYKSDGTCYRWWQATLKAVELGRIIVVSPVGQRVEGVGGGWTSEHVIRAYYWLDRWYSLLEVYTPAGQLVEIYVNIGSPVEIAGLEMRFTDYELDVSLEPPQAARIVDEDEFQEAVTRYGYSPAFQQACYAAAHEALAVANGWVARGRPACICAGLPPLL